MDYQGDFMRLLLVAADCRRAQRLLDQSYSRTNQHFAAKAEGRLDMLLEMLHDREKFYGIAGKPAARE